MINCLIKHGADLDAQDMAGRTSLLIAVKCDFINIIRFLLIKGASPRIKDMCKKIAIDYAKNNIARKLLEVGNY